MTAGKKSSAFTDDRVIAVRQFADEVMRKGGPGCLFDLGRRRVWAAIGDVVANRVVEEHGFLRYQRYLPPQTAQLRITNVDAVPSHLAGNGIMKARQQFCKRTLAPA